MNRDEAKNLFAYNQWANTRFTDALRGLEPGLLTKPLVSSFPSLLETCGHLVGAEWVWLRRWLGESPGGIPDWVTRPLFEDLMARLTGLESERDAFLQTLGGSELDGAVAYRFISGDSRVTPLADLFVHVVNHSSFHRGQLTTLLRQVGATPPSTDYILYTSDFR